MKIQQEVSITSSRSDLQFENTLVGYNQELLLLPLFMLCFLKTFFFFSVTLMADKGTIDLRSLYTALCQLENVFSRDDQMVQP